MPAADPVPSFFCVDFEPDFEVDFEFELDLEFALELCFEPLRLFELPVFFDRELVELPLFLDRELVFVELVFVAIDQLFDRVCDLDPLDGADPFRLRLELRRELLLEDFFRLILPSSIVCRRPVLVSFSSST